VNESPTKTGPEETGRITIGETHSGEKYRDTIHTWKAKRSGILYRKSLFLEQIEDCISEDVENILRRADLVDKIEESTDWTMLTMTDKTGNPKFRKHLTKKMRKDGCMLTFKSDDHVIGMAKFPLQSPIVTSPIPDICSYEVVDLNRELRTHIDGFQSAISQEALERLKERIDRMLKDWAQAQLPNPESHRRRACSGHRSGELRLMLGDYHPAIQKIIRLGMVVHFDSTGRPSIVETSPIPDEKWGFDASVLRDIAIEIEWPDKELIHFLRFGFHDYSERTPPISSLSPHQQKALDNIRQFKSDIAKDIEKGWIQKTGTEFPSFLPFRVIPGSVEPKKQPGLIRVVWNASHPLPQGREGVVVDPKHGEIPINSNMATQLPGYLSFEWAAPESIGLSIAILEPLAIHLNLPILGRTFDFSGWFRQLKMSNAEAWKSSILLDDGFHVDLRMQMGRSASAHSGQRLSSLIAAKLSLLAAEQEWGRESYSDAQLEIIEAWGVKRRMIWSCCSQARTIIFMVYQDDLTVICMGTDAAKIIDKHINDKLAEWKIPVSIKPETSKPFSTVFDALGATFDLSIVGKFSYAPSSKSIERLAEVAKVAKRLKGKFVDLLTMQKWAGIYYYTSKFVRNGRAKCNEIFSLLKPRRESGFKVCLVTSKLVEDLMAMLEEIQSTHVVRELIDNPFFATKGLSAFTSDASGNFLCPKSGWGVSALTRISAKPWGKLTRLAIQKGKISISQLELLAVAILVHTMVPILQECEFGRVIIFTDSECAVPVINTGRTRSSTMAKALNILHRSCDTADVELLAVHIPGELNKISDALSRGGITQAKSLTKRLFGASVWIEPSAEVISWEKELACFALQSRSATDRDTV